MKFQYAVACYHVTNRGRRGDEIFEYTSSIQRSTVQGWIQGNPFEAYSYLLELLRYIHKNPLEAGLVDNLQKYNWRSHKGYLFKARKWDRRVKLLE